MWQNNFILRVAVLLPFFYLSLICFAQHPGTLDETFGDSGKVIISISNGLDVAEAVAIQSDQKIVVVGRGFYSTTGQDFVVIRCNSDGSLDSSFGNNGIVNTDVQGNSYDGAYDLVIQPDGKILVGGYSEKNNDKRATLLKYDIDGVLDTTFGNGGKVLTSFIDNHDDEIRALKVDTATGKIVVCGTSFASPIFSKPIIARYMQDGTLDNTFNNNGVVAILYSSSDTASRTVLEDVYIMANGKIGAGGWKEKHDPEYRKGYFYCQLKDNGTRDSIFDEFAHYGIVVNSGSPQTEIQCILGYDDNSILFAGAIESDNLFTPDNYRMFLQKWDTTGTPIALEVFFFYRELAEIIYSISRDNNGRYVTAGVITDELGGRRFLITRLDSTYEYDPSFGEAGFPDYSGGGGVTSQFDNNNMNGAYDLAIQLDNKIVAVGYIGNDIGIARYNNYDVATLDSFHLELPADSQVGVNPSAVGFEWTDAVGAVYYEMELDTAPSFSSTAYALYSTFSSENLISGLDTNTTYYWRVKATNQVSWSAWSEVWQFTTDTVVSGVWVNEHVEREVKIYPIPANNWLMVNGAYPNENLCIIDAVGRVVYAGQIKSTSEMISLDYLANGSYFIIISGGDKLVRKPLIILK